MNKELLNKYRIIKKMHNHCIKNTKVIKTNVSLEYK